jgi:hypothetical protein
LHPEPDPAIPPAKETGEESESILAQVSLLGANFANFSGSWAREAA